MKADEFEGHVKEQTVSGGDARFTATATITIAASFLFHGLRRRRLGLLSAAVLICVSQVYVGTHYVADVLGGAATGLMAAATVRMLY